MNGRRTLGALLSELADGVAGFAGHGDGVRARSIAIALPIELRLVATQGGFEVIGDVPLFLTRTDFDSDPCRLEVAWHAVPAEAQP